jgi:hypothetical protein
MAASRWLPFALVAIALAGAPAGPATAHEALTAEAVAQRVAERYGVEVLDVAPSDGEGSPAYIVTVMNPGGNSNGAFRVTRLMVDRMTGELISQFHHEAAGYVLPGGAASLETQGADGRAIRRMSNQ